MEPLPQAIASFEQLAAKFDTYILSTSPWGNPSAWSDKLLWVKRHLGEVALLGRQEWLKVLCGKDYSKKKKDKIPYKTVHCPSKRT